MVTIVSATPIVYIIHDHAKWLAPLRHTLTSADIPFDDSTFDISNGGVVDVTQVPPEGIFFNRPSPSAHTRGSSTMELSNTIVSWLTLYDRRVINSFQALSMEMSKQYTDVLLRKSGIKTAASVAVSGRANLVSFLSNFAVDKKFLLKHNRGGSGSGVRLFSNVATALDYVNSDSQFQEPIDGITLVSNYIESPERCMYRLEFVGGRLVYAVRVDTSAMEENKAINNCPADSCTMCTNSLEHACPLKTKQSKFEVLNHFDHSIIDQIEEFGKIYNLDIYGVEIIVDKHGEAHVIDFNACNTNYNTRAEKKAKVLLGGYDAVANFLKKELDQLHTDIL